MCKVDIACGNGGLEMNNLLDKHIKPPINNPHLRFPIDSAHLLISGNDLLFTTDSHIIDPIFFPGGDIGKLSVCGTVNDILVSGGRPLYLSLSFILEEGFDIADLTRIMESISLESVKTGIEIVTGDTKVVERGKGDKIFINTSGIGIPIFEPLCHYRNIKAGDDIIITGPIAQHGVAVLVQREGIKLDTAIESDVCSLHPLVYALKDAGIVPRFMTDPTRGGLSSALNEIASSTDFGVIISEETVPVNQSVLAVCEILGLNQYEIPSEGVAVIITDKKDTDKAISALRKISPIGQDAAVIGRISDSNRSRVVLNTRVGTDVLLNLPEGLNLPRIC